MNNNVTQNTVSDPNSEMLIPLPSTITTNAPNNNWLITASYGSFNNVKFTYGYVISLTNGQCIYKHGRKLPKHIPMRSSFDAELYGVYMLTKHIHMNQKRYQEERIKIYIDNMAVLDLI